MDAKFIFIIVKTSKTDINGLTISSATVVAVDSLLNEKKLIINWRKTIGFNLFHEIKINGVNINGFTSIHKTEITGLPIKDVKEFSQYGY